MLRQLTSSTSQMDQMKKQKERLNELAKKLKNERDEFKKTTMARLDTEGLFDQTNAEIQICKVTAKIYEQKITEKTQEIRILQRV